jgi:hypothetical protein
VVSRTKNQETISKQLGGQNALGRQKHHRQIAEKKIHGGFKNHQKTQATWSNYTCF